MKKLVLLLAWLLSWSVASAQNTSFAWKLNYEWLFDNREYKSEFVIPQTIFGARLSPEFEVDWNDVNSINVGAQVFVSMGKKGYFEQAIPLMYYNYRRDKVSLSAGVIPRYNMVSEFPSAFFSDSTNYYRSSIQGCLFNYIGSRGYVEAGCSWVGLIDENTREQFMIFSSAQISAGKFVAGYYLNVMHYAMRKGEHGVVDNILALPYVGMNIGKVGSVLDDFSFKMGLLASMQRDRNYGGKRNPAGFYGDVNLKKWRFGINNSIFLGENMMPFYNGRVGDYYGADLYYGDPYYRTTHNIYNRLEVYWQAVDKRRVTFKVASVHHYDGRKWDWQQVLRLTVNLGGKF